MRKFEDWYESECFAWEDVRTEQQKSIMCGATSVMCPDEPVKNKRVADEPVSVFNVTDIERSIGDGNGQ